MKNIVYLLILFFILSCQKDFYLDDLDAINIKIDQLKSEIELKLKESARLVSNKETIEEQLLEVQNQLNTNQISLLEANLLQQKEKLKRQEKTSAQLETKNIELKELLILIRSSNSFNSELADAELKERFVQKDFEVSGVNPSDLTKQTKIYPTPRELKGNSAIYAVQFGVYMQVQPYAALKGLDEVWYETTEHGTYVYLSGQFKSPQKATEHKNSLITLGYPNAFVVTLTK